MEIACLDLEGVLVPEVWIGVADKTGITALRATTRDIPDYDELMRQRLSLLEQHGLKLADLQAVIGTLKPLKGALAFLDWLRPRFQVIILSDTFYQFATPLMHRLGWPTLFCNHLEIDGEDRIIGYRLRQPDQKRQAIKALHALDFRTIAAGDSYNDTGMLAEADAGIFFRPPRDIARQFPQYPVTEDYEALRAAFTRASIRPIQAMEAAPETP
uniref:phosphoserine phosphatase n=1 Tax=Candidatus Kentrum eta TaxID=2126337 RepID=A0A450U862_9GAMM|nr:MAG: phosphoserine phosphatase [Candidatus Kentron sp. H]VFJ90034.1 MAG: phosphoserine phosphatase [Candidatus Kentron sp. H]VFJ96409.1 MAG: phosphoserine phosphatase [Candidatus Kentron sp. H]